MKTELNGVFHLGTKQVFARAELGRYVADYLGLNSKLIHSGYMKEVVVSSELVPINPPFF